MPQTNVDVLRETASDVGEGWLLCFQWTRYRYEDENIQFGYRFIYRHNQTGHLLPQRGQARIPTIAIAHLLMTRAIEDGWGDRDGDRINEAASRLLDQGCIVDLRTGYVGWANREAALQNGIDPTLLADEQLIRSWSQ